MGVLVPSAESKNRSADGRRDRVSLLHRAIALPVRSLWFQSALLLAAFWIYHLWLTSLMQCGRLRLGAVSHKLAPLYAYWDPRLKGGLLLALAVLAGYALFLRRFLRTAPFSGGRLRHAASSHGRHEWKSIALLTAWMPVLAIAVAGIDGNLGRIARPFERTDIEYYGAVSRVGDLRTFIGTYPQHAGEMPMHAQTHPPGAVLFLWAATRLVGDSALRAALAAILFSALSVPAVYLLARDLGGEPLARLSAALYLLMPGVLLFTATSMDGPFAVVLIWSIYLGWRSAWRCSVPAGFAAGLVLALAGWMTFSASVVGLFVVIAVCLAASRRRASDQSTPFPFRKESRGGAPPNATASRFHSARLLRSAVPLLALLAGILTFYVPLYAATGYHPADMLATAMSISGRLMGATGHASLSQHAHIAAANLAVFFLACGVPVAVLWLRYAVHLLRTGWRCPLGTAVAAFVATLAVTDLLPLYSLETERIWIFLAPLMVIPAAAELLRPARPANDVRRRTTAPGLHVGEGRRDATHRAQHFDADPRRRRSLVLLLAAQTVVTELLLGTYW